jgi:hypothetical protein
MIIMRCKMFSLIGIFILGAVIGGVIGESIGKYRTLRFLGSFFSDGSNLSTILAIKEKVFVLSKIHDGKMDEATETLERALDHDLMAFFVGIHSSENTKTETKKALKVAKDYRSKFPRATNHPETDKAVASAFAEADN